MKILINSNYYLPGINSGGNLVSIKNLIEKLSDIYEFNLITRDRDLGDKQFYKNIILDKWLKLQSNKIRYISKKKQSFYEFKKIINEQNYNLIYLNSFFDLFTIKILILKKLSFINNIPLILAPKGELSKNSLKIKKLKKIFFLFFFKNFFNIYSNIYFLASSEMEKKEIESLNFKKRLLIHVAKDIVVKKNINFNQAVKFKSKVILSLCYISRITPKKNLLLLLEYLLKFKKKYTLHIYGHIDDKKYYNKCLKLINLLNNENNFIKYMGIIKPDDVVDKLNQYHAMLLLTKNENFGHIISESFNAGTPVIISDETIWTELEKKKIGWNVTLNNYHQFINKLNYLDNCSDNEYLTIRENVYKYFQTIKTDKSVFDNIQVIQKIINT